MGTVKTSPFVARREDVAYLPVETPLPMPTSRLDAVPERTPFHLRASARRVLIFAGTAGMTAAGAYEMYDVLKVGGVTILEGMILALFVVLLAWIAFSFM